jgi:hypothetical protein
MEPMKAFFTPGSIATFTGATSAVWIITNVFRVLVGRDSVIAGFIIALIVAFVGAYSTQALNGLVPGFLVFLNGCLLFFTAAGVQGFANGATQGRPVAQPKVQGRGRVKFLTPWFVGNTGK